MELWHRYRRDGSADAMAALLEAYRPLVASVCRRYLRNHADVEDAIQTIFTKMLRHIDVVQGGPAAWLTATAHSTCVDTIRQAKRERQRLDKVKAHPPDHPLDLHDLSQPDRIAQLEAAMRSLDGASRQLISERFFGGALMRVIAGREGKSVATISRRVSGALDELKSAMGMHEAQEDCLDGGSADACGAGLRYAADWEALGPPRQFTQPELLTPSYRTGWNRPIRVGALVSHIGGITPSSGYYFTPEKQLWWAKFVGDPGFDMVGIVEPLTEGIGHIECAVREFELTAGLIDGTDRAALATLDVIVLPPFFASHLGVLEAVRDVVAQGVGLYNQWWKSTDTERELDPVIMQIMLSDSPIGTYHTPEGHGWPIPATVREEHPVIPGLAARTPLKIPGCGPLYRPVENARALITKDKLVESPGTPELEPARMPVLLAGQIGRGRVIVDHKGFVPESFVAHRFTTHVLEWLAAPRLGDLV